MMSRVQAVVVALVVFTLHFSFIDPAKRRNCKISDLKNTTLEFGECMVNNCTVYWCCDETDRYGELFKYQCEHTVLRLYPPLTRECRKHGCIPEFTWSDDYLTESSYERTMTSDPLIERITAGIPPDFDMTDTTDTTGGTNVMEATEATEATETTEFTETTGAAETTGTMETAIPETAIAITGCSVAKKFARNDSSRKRAPGSPTTLHT